MDRTGSTKFLSFGSGSYEGLNEQKILIYEQNPRSVRNFENMNRISFDIKQKIIKIKDEERKITKKNKALGAAYVNVKDPVGPEDRADPDDPEAHEDPDDPSAGQCEKESNVAAQLKHSKHCSYTPIRREKIAGNSVPLKRHINIIKYLGKYKRQKRKIKGIFLDENTGERVHSSRVTRTCDLNTRPRRRCHELENLSTSLSWRKGRQRRWPPECQYARGRQTGEITCQKALLVRGGVEQNPACEDTNIPDKEAGLIKRKSTATTDVVDSQQPQQDSHPEINSEEEIRTEAENVALSEQPPLHQENNEATSSVLQTNKGHAELSIDGYTLFRQDRKRQRGKRGRDSGGVAVYMKNDLAADMPDDIFIQKPTHRNDAAKDLVTNPMKMAKMLTEQYNSVFSTPKEPMPKVNEIFSDTRSRDQGLWWYSKEWSCLSQLIAHFDHVTKLLENNQNVDVVYLDFSKAFDKFECLRYGNDSDIKENTCYKTPSDHAGIKYVWHPRRGRNCIVPAVNLRGSRHFQTIRYASFGVRGPRLFNTLPKSIKNITGCSVDTFKHSLDKYLSTVPDEPQIRGYTANRRTENNSLIKMAQLATSQQIQLDEDSHS
ncbi:unnamed protein product, partial [Meganyctiphanes norvegica]